MKIIRKEFQKAVYWLSDIVILALGAFCLYLGLTSGNYILAGFGVALGMIIGGIGLAIFLELTRASSKLLGW